MIANETPLDGQVQPPIDLRIFATHLIWVYYIQQGKNFKPAKIIDTFGRGYF